MKITFLCTDKSLQRGSERMTAALANALANQNEVTVISLYRNHEVDFFEIHPDVKQIYVCEAKRSTAVVAKIFQKINELLAVSKFLRIEKHTMYIGVGAYCSILLGLFAWLNRRNRYIAWEHAAFKATKGKWNKLRSVFYKNLNAIVCLNETEKRDYQKQFANVFVIPNFLVSKATTKADLATKQFLSVGGLEQEKGFDLLINAYRELDVSDWKLLIVGSGSKKKMLEALIEKNGLEGRVTLQPFRKDIEQAYLNSGCYILPSRSESFGMVLLEAMDHGLPCVAFDCPSGPRYLISNQINGLLVPPNNERLLAEAMSTIAKDRALAERFVAQSEKEVEKYLISGVLPKWINLFKYLQNADWN